MKDGREPEAGGIRSFDGGAADVGQRQRLRLLELEEQDRLGYQARPQRIEEFLPWEEIASWPLCIATANIRFRHAPLYGR